MMTDYYATAYFEKMPSAEEIRAEYEDAPLHNFRSYKLDYDSEQMLFVAKLSATLDTSD